MFQQKTEKFFCTILCTFSIFTSIGQNGAYSFALSASAHTSAGVFKANGTLVRTLWADSIMNPGTYTRYWDGKDDFGNTIASPDANYNIKVLSNNVSYVWDGVVGNTSLNKTGYGVHRGYYTSITGMAITGTTAYFCQGYSEAFSSQAKFSTSDPQVRINLNGFNGRVSTIEANYVATDGTNVYWAGWNPNNAASCRSLVHATRVTDDAQVSFGANGQGYTVSGIGAGKTYSSVIDFSTATGSTPTGLAVQPSGTYLFVCHGGLNQLKVFNKTSGALVQTLTYTNPRNICIEGSSVWMVTGTSTVAKYDVNSDGTLTSATLTLSGVVAPGALAVSGSNLIVVDAGTRQAIRFFNSTTGVEGTQLGTTGGYSTSPTVTNTKYMFNDFRGHTDSYIAVNNSDGSFWFGDPGNYRSLHFNSSKNYLEYIMSLPTTYSTCVDPNNISRVFANYLEFNVNYSQSLSGNTGWSLANNWAYGINVNYTDLRKLLNVVTLSNGRTYGRSYDGVGGYMELTASGLRSTGVSVTGNINTDGSQMKVSGSNALGSNITFTSYPLSGFDGSGNPSWSASGTLLATTPTNTLTHPNVNPASINPASYNYVTSSNKVIFYLDHLFYNGNTSQPYTGYHLGAINKGGNTWLWETQRVNHPGYQGAFPKPDYFEVGNGVNQLGGSSVNVVDNNIITGYHGEFWKNGQTNYYNHYLDNGLAVGQFGTDFWEITRDLNTYPPPSLGYAGNALTPLTVKDGSGNLYLYHGDESHHAGIHRWSITNLSSISEQSQTIPFPSSYIPPPLGYVDLHAGLPFYSTLTGTTANWTKTGTTNVNTSLKKYINDGSPDVFATFNQTSGTACVSRDLGTNNVATNWKISGYLTFEGSDVYAGSQIVSYADVLDASGKILARFYYSNVYATGVTTIFGNTATIASTTGLGSTLLQFQPFEVKCENGQVTFTYANFSPVSTTISDGTGNWRTPKTLRMYFTGAPINYQKNIGLKDMRLFTDYGVIPNIVPTANAGPDTSITLPQNTITLSGSGNDADGIISGYLWTKLSGPSSYSLSNASAATSSVTNLVEGVYRFVLTVTDNNGATGKDTVQITVSPSTNKSPMANAGPDQTIKLPTNLVSLAGSGADVDGTIVTYEWSKISGPPTYSFVNSSSPVTDVFGLTEGLYQFQLKVTDDDGATGSDTVIITVQPVQNLLPTVDAGSDQLLLLPITTTDLTGSAADADGVIQTYQWSSVSGPPAVIFTNAASPSTSVKFPAEGLYRLELKVIDNNGGIGSDTVLVSVVSGVLPLGLLHFEVALLRDEVQLFWTAVNDENVESFQVEKLQDQEWFTIGGVAPSSLLSAQHTYQFSDGSPSSGDNIYRLKIISKDGKQTYSDIRKVNFSVHTELLGQNFPNPFIQFTSITFKVISTAHIRIQVFNSVGMQMDKLIDEVKAPGSYKINWSPHNLTKGIYYYQCFLNGERIATKKMIKLR